MNNNIKVGDKVKFKKGTPDDARHFGVLMPYTRIGTVIESPYTGKNSLKKSKLIAIDFDGNKTPYLCFEDNLEKVEDE